MILSILIALAIWHLAPPLIVGIIRLIVIWRATAPYVPEPPPPPPRPKMSWRRFGAGVRMFAFACVMLVVTGVVAYGVGTVLRILFWDYI